MAMPNKKIEELKVLIKYYSQMIFETNLFMIDQEDQAKIILQKQLALLKQKRSIAQNKLRKGILSHGTKN